MIGAQRRSDEDRTGSRHIVSSPGMFFFSHFFKLYYWLSTDRLQMATQHRLFPLSLSLPLHNSSDKPNKDTEHTQTKHYKSRSGSRWTGKRRRQVQQAWDAHSPRFVFLLFLKNSTKPFLKRKCGGRILHISSLGRQTQAQIKLHFNHYYEM